MIYDDEYQPVAFVLRTYDEAGGVLCCGDTRQVYIRNKAATSEIILAFLYEEPNFQSIWASRCVYKPLVSYQKIQE